MSFNLDSFCFSYKSYVQANGSGSYSIDEHWTAFKAFLEAHTCTTTFQKPYYPSAYFIE